MNENKFIRDDFFISDYLAYDSNVEEVSKKNKTAWKEVYAFIHSCNKAGRQWSETDVMNLCENHFLNKEKVTRAFKRIYKDHADEFGLDNMPPWKKVSLLLSKNYDLHKNVITGQLMDGEKVLNRSNIVMLVEKAGLKYPTEKLFHYLDSDEIPTVDPISDYFESLPKWDGKDHIGELCKYFKTDNDEFFASMLKKHMVRSISCSIDFQYNRYVFVLSGDVQNIGKSYFIEWLNPFGKQYFTQTMPKNEKDLMLSLAQNFIINLDELAAMSKMDINNVKSLISQSVVQERRAYRKDAETLPRRANFWGTTNESEFLIDSSNSRWIVFNIESIDWEGYSQALNVVDLWAQAWHLKNDSDFYAKLTNEEIKLQNSRNKGYESNEIEKDLVKIHFRIKGGDGDFYSNSDILKHLQEVSGLKLNSRYIPRMMRQLGFKGALKKVNGHICRGFYVEKIKGSYIDFMDGKQEKLF